MEKILTSHQWSEWVAYNNVEWIGEQRADLRIARLTAEFVNRNRGKNESAKRTEDFMHFYEKPPQTDEEMYWELQRFLGG